MVTMLIIIITIKYMARHADIALVLIARTTRRRFQARVLQWAFFPPTSRLEQCEGRTGEGELPGRSLI